MSLVLFDYNKEGTRETVLFIVTKEILITWPLSLWRCKPYVAWLCKYGMYWMDSAWKTYHFL